MSQVKGRAWHGVLARAIVGALGLAGALPAWGAEPTQQDLQEQIRALRAKVDELQAKVDHQDPTQAQATQATVDSVVGDADRHSQSLDLGGLTAGYDPVRGFVIQSADGRFLIHPWLLLHVRGVINARENGKDFTASGESSSDTQSGLEVRRAYYAVDGNAFTPDLTYLFIWTSDRHTGNLFPLDEWVRYHVPNTPYSIKAGQIQNPLDHEQLAYSRYQMAAERSLTDDVLAGGDDYVQGVQISYDNGRDLRAFVAATDGFNNFNKNFQDFPVNKANFGFAGRLEYKAMGTWKQYLDFTARGNSEDLLVFGGGIDWTEAGHKDAVRHVVDVQYENTAGLGAYAAYLGRYTARGSNTGGDTYDPSVRLQLSYALDRHWEPFARYDFFHLDKGGLPAGVRGSVHELAAGVNYYVYDQHLKFTLDVLYLPNGSPATDDASGVLGTGGAAAPGSSFSRGGGNEVVVRAQFQLYL